jgi:hypothetical protein
MSDETKLPESIEKLMPPIERAIWPDSAEGFRRAILEELASRDRALREAREEIVALRRDCDYLSSKVLARVAQAEAAEARAREVEQAHEGACACLTQAEARVDAARADSNRHWNRWTSARQWARRWKRAAVGLRGSLDAADPACRGFWNLWRAKNRDFDEVVSQRNAARAELAALREQKDGAYLERDQLVALAARMARALGWRVGLRVHEPYPDPTWEPDWCNVVLIDLPTGQVSWHYHDSERPLFDGLPPYPSAWDGHSTAEKYLRVGECRPKRLAQPDSEAAQAELAALRTAGEELAAKWERYIGYGQGGTEQYRSTIRMCATALRALLSERGADGGGGVPFDRDVCPHGYSYQRSRPCKCERTPDTAPASPLCECGHPVTSDDPVCPEWGPADDDCSCTNHRATPRLAAGRREAVTTPAKPGAPAMPVTDPVTAAEVKGERDAAEEHLANGLGSMDVRCGLMLRLLDEIVSLRAEVASARKALDWALNQVPLDLGDTEWREQYLAACALSSSPAAKEEQE